MSSELESALLASSRQRPGPLPGDFSRSVMARIMEAPPQQPTAWQVALMAMTAAVVVAVASHRSETSNAANVPSVLDASISPFPVTAR